jgi:hypothetical protein
MLMGPMNRPFALIVAIAAAGCPGRVSGPIDRQAGEAGHADRQPLPTVNPTGPLTSVSIDGIPFVQQKPDFCGEACVEMAARRLGKTYDQDAVFAATGVDPALGRGAWTRDLVRAVKQLGFSPGDVWYSIDASDPQPGLDAAFAAIHADLERGVPTIVCMHYDDRPNTTEHFRLVTGYDADRDEVIYQEPAEADGANRRMSLARFEALWPLPYAKDRWTLVRIPLAPAVLVDPPAEPGFSAADYAQHVLALRESLAAKGLDGLSIRIEEPFVVVGDGGDAALAERSRTVRWAADHLEADFFAKRPSRILDVYLFAGAASYEKGTIALTGEEPTTPYGFYSSANDALVMDISTGGGTLVHEIVHPYVEADFPDAPAWLNEGLGSLFEQSGEVDGHIVGRTNWRLAGLQRGIDRGDVPSFAELTSMSDSEFYAEERGTNYAQARYLMYYLQEKGLLHTFYRSFRANRAKDPTGYATLVKTLGERDMDAFHARWQRFVSNLSFP